MYQISLFTGAMGGDLATVHLLGWRPVLYVERDEYVQRLIKQRIKDGFMPDAPIWGDIRTLRGRVLESYRELAEKHPVVLTAGFPCQPWATGGKGQGQDDDRNLWPDTVRVIGEVRPTWVLLENSTRLLQVSHQWGRPPYIQQIAGDLALLGYVGRYGCLSAASLGFDHKRQRLWIVAHANGQGWKVILRSDERDGRACDAQKAIVPVTLDAVWSRLARLEERLGEPSVFRTDDGMAEELDFAKTATER